jgi:hypothetical protein
MASAFFHSVFTKVEIRISYKVIMGVRSCAARLAIFPPVTGGGSLLLSWPVRKKIENNPVISLRSNSRIRGCTEELVADSDMGRLTPRCTLGKPAFPFASEREESEFVSVLILGEIFN